MKLMFYFQKFPPEAQLNYEAYVLFSKTPPKCQIEIVYTSDPKSIEIEIVYTSDSENEVIGATIHKTYWGNNSKKYWGNNSKNYQRPHRPAFPQN